MKLSGLTIASGTGSILYLSAIFFSLPSAAYRALLLGASAR